MGRNSENSPADRGKVVRLPGTRTLGSGIGIDPVAADASAPDVLDLRADARDVAAADRDRAAEAWQSTAVSDRREMELVLMLARRDRAAAALDRHEAALDRRRAAEYLQRAYRDELTGALLRHAGREVLSQQLARARRSDEGLVIAFLDVVGLKRINDSQGHAAGDALLRAVGFALKVGLRAYDTVVRYGGDEFVCALPEADVAAATVRFDEVAEWLSAAYPGGTVSVGLVAVDPGESLDDAIARADRALYSSRKDRPARGTPTRAVGESAAEDLADGEPP